MAMRRRRMTQSTKAKAPLTRGGPSIRNDLASGERFFALLGRGLGSRRRRGGLRRIVVVEAAVVQDLFSHQHPQSILELEVLDEQVVLGLEVLAALRALEEERQP